MTRAEQIAAEWRSRLKTELSRSNDTTRESIVRWLLGEDLDRFDSYTPERLEIEVQAMDYRYRILIQRYFETPTRL